MRMALIYAMHRHLTRGVWVSSGTQKPVSIARPREQILALSNGAFPLALLRRMRLQHFASL